MRMNNSRPSISTICKVAAYEWGLQFKVLAMATEKRQEKKKIGSEILIKFRVISRSMTLTLTQTLNTCSHLGLNGLYPFVCLDSNLLSNFFDGE